MILEAATALAIVASPADCLKIHELAHAGGWGPDHPGAIYTKHCGHLPMPPHAFPLAPGVRAYIYHVPREEITRYCGFAQACSQIGGSAPWIYLPK